MTRAVVSPKKWAVRAHGDGMPRLLLSGELHPNLATHGRVLARGQAGRRLRVRLRVRLPGHDLAGLHGQVGHLRLDALPASMRCPACRGGVRAKGAPGVAVRAPLRANAEHFEDFMARRERLPILEVLDAAGAAHVERQGERVVFDDPDARWERAKAKAVLRAMRVDYYVGWYEHPCPHTLQALLAQEARNFHGEAVPPCARWQLVRLADDV